MVFSPGFSVPRPPMLQRITSRQWLGFDFAVAGLFFVSGAANIFWENHTHRHFSHLVVLVVALCLATLPLAVRRRYPIPVLIVVTAALAAATILGEGFAGIPVVALPLFTVATSYPRRDSVVALVIVEVALLVALGIEAVLQPTGGNVSFNIILAGATWFVGDSIRSRRAYVIGLTEQAEQRQRREIERAQQSIAEERLQIARELHDIVAHSLSVIAIQAGVGGHVLDLQPEEARKALAAVELTSRSALEELRRVLGVLRRDETDGPSLAPAPGLADLEPLFAQFSAAGVDVTCHRQGDVVHLPPSMDLSVYRIVQEGLTNVTKHAGTGQATVDITFEADAVVVSVRNDGTSYLNRAMATAGGDDTGSHHGIIGMRERAAIFGGTLTAGPRPEGGFEVKARLPFAAVGS